MTEGGEALACLRRAEKAKTGDPVSKSCLLILTRARDNKTRQIEMSQLELSKRAEFGVRRLPEKLALLDNKFIVRERQFDRYGHRRWDRITVLDLDDDGNPVATTEPGCVGLAAGVAVREGTSYRPKRPLGLTANSCIPNGQHSALSKKASPSLRNLPEKNSSSKSSPTNSQTESPKPAGAKSSKKPVTKTKIQTRDNGDQKAPKRSPGRSLPPQEPSRDAAPKSRNGLPAKTISPPLRLTANSSGRPNGHRPVPTVAEIREALAAVPWPRIHEPCEQFDVGIEDLIALGFNAMASGLLVTAPGWYPHRTGEINRFVAEACQEAGDVRS